MRRRRHTEDAMERRSENSDAVGPGPRVTPDTGRARAARRAERDRRVIRTSVTRLRSVRAREFRKRLRRVAMN